MANDGAQTGGNEERREDSRDTPVNEGGELAGVSNGTEKEIVVPLAPAVAATATKTDKPKTGEGSTAEPVVAPPAEEEIAAPKAKTVVPPVTAPKTTEGGSTAVAEETAPPPPPQNQAQAPKEDEYNRDKPKTPGPTAPAAETEEEIRDTKKMRALLNDKWGLQWPDPVLHNIMQKGSVSKGFGGIVFELENGSTIKWHENLLGQGEFVGKTGLFIKISEEEAQATVAVAKNRGWTKINVYGKLEQKEMFWLEAKKQGLEVANFQPMADSKIFEKWAEYQQKNADKTLGGVQNAENAPFDVKGEVKPGADELPGAARRAAEAEAAAKLAEGGATPKPAESEEAPKTIAASTIAGKSLAATAAATAAAAATAPEATTPAATVETVAAAATGPKGAEEIKAFFATKIDECHHPKLKEGLGRICDKLCADGVDEKVVKEVCDKVGGGKLTVKDHNDLVAIVNEKLPSESPLIALGFRQQPRAPGGPKA